MIKVELVDEKNPVEKSVDEDLRLFDDWFQSLGNERLSKPEKAIIKTYLAYKLGVVKK